MNEGIVRGASWSVLLRVVDRGIGLVSTVVLARLLVPADFGVVALAISLIELIGLLGAFGLELSLIQNPHADRRHFDAVWTFNVLFGLVLCALLLLIASPAAAFYGEPLLAQVIVGLAIARAVAGFQNVGVVLFQKEMAFDRDFRYRLYRRLATTFLATIPLALVFRNHWALVGGTIAGSCIGLVLSYTMHPYRPRLSLTAFRELFVVSRWLQIALLVRVVTERSTDFIIAKFAGVTALGSFTVAKEIAQVPSAELTMAIHGGVFPGYAKISADLPLLKQTYLRTAAILHFVTLPAGIGMMLVAQPVVTIFLGGKWQSVVPLLQILALNYVLSVTSRSAGYIYLALGTTRRNATLALLRAAVSLSAMLMLVPSMGAEGAAFALLAGTLAVAPVNIRMLSGALGLALRELVAIAWRPVLATIFMAAALSFVASSWTAADTLGTSVINLAFAAAIGAAAYASAIIVLWRAVSRPDGAETFVLGRVTTLAAALRGRFRV